MPDELDEIAALPPNWDGYGGCAFRPEVIDHARKVLTALQAAGIDVEVTPNPNGTVSLEWQFASLECGAIRGVGILMPSAEK